MKPDIQKVYSAWDELATLKTNQPTQLTRIRINEIMGNLFTSGPFAYFVIDFFDMQISHVSSTFEDMFGLSADGLTMNDILGLLHPDDVAFVAKAEELSAHILYNTIGKEKALRYKTNYCFRARVADGSYQLFLHQAIALTTDEHGRFGKALNILTNIQHLTTKNNYKLSMVGIMGEPSYLNIDVNVDNLPASSGPPFTKREIELIRLIAAGNTNKKIAAQLNISIETVKNHRKNITRKAGVKSSAELISRCIQDGVI
jgi:Response regulator containing a CheY-like receiver domain and an HTH DNA-binding domain